MAFARLLRWSDLCTRTMRDALSALGFGGSRRVASLSLFFVTTCAMFVLGVATGNSLDGTSVQELRGYFKREHSLVRPYQGSGMSIPFWDIVGSTVVSSQYVRLTADVKSRNGALWNTAPCQSRDWELMITFAVHGSKGDLFGDGLAIWYAKDRSKLGPVFGNIDYFHGLAIFADTYSNHNGPHNHAHPYISAMVNNGTLHYDHDRDGTHTQLAGCEAKFRNKDYETNLLIRYAEDTVTVYTDIHGKGHWQLCFAVPGVILPTGYYFGASAGTGDLADNHDILAIRMYELDIPRPESAKSVDRKLVLPQAEKYEAQREHVVDEKPPMSGFKLALIVIALIVVGVVVVVGVLVFQQRQEQSRKRFY